MAKIYLNDLASVLVDKHGITKKDAGNFITAIVEVIHDAVSTDKLVKIKGLGTFKVIDVDARESISVNTGERVVINGHQKLTFTPDNAMKDLVNKPFSQFETVILNEGVTFDDLSESDSTSEEKESSEESVEGGDTAVEVENEEPQPVVEEEPLSVVENEEPQPVVEEEPLSVVENEEPQPVVEEEPQQVVEEDMQKDEVESTKHDEQVKSRQPLWIALALLACGVSFGSGYYVGRHTTYNDIVKTDTIATPVPAQTRDTLTTTDTLQVPTEVQQPIVSEQPKDEEVDYLKYNNMDARVRTGAYYIIGTDHVVTAKEGDNVARIARRTIGAGMECYIEVYNGVTRETVLQEGQEIKIPKLRTKTSMRRDKRRKEKADN